LNEQLEPLPPLEQVPRTHSVPLGQSPLLEHCASVSKTQTFSPLDDSAQI
jgi:hypothetical protein